MSDVNCQRCGKEKVSRSADFWQKGAQSCCICRPSEISGTDFRSSIGTVPQDWNEKYSELKYPGPAARGEKCVNCKGWISPPLVDFIMPRVAFIISDSQRYPACVCGNPCSLLDSLFGKAPSPPKLPPDWTSVSPRQCPGPPPSPFATYEGTINVNNP